MKKELANKSLTSLGSPVESNLSKGLHESVVKMINVCEKEILKQTNGRYTLSDVLQINPNNPVQALKELLLSKECKIGN